MRMQGVIEDLALPANYGGSGLAGPLLAYRELSSRSLDPKLGGSNEPPSPDWGCRPFS